MDLTPYVEKLREELVVAAKLGGDEARDLAERLVGPLDSAVRLALLEALTAAAGEITVELAPGSVEVRLRGREPDFVVTPPPAETVAADVAAPAPPVADADDAASARINFRLGDQLKTRIEEAAGREGLSVNAWLVRVASVATAGGAPPPAARRGAHGAQRYTGWVR